MKEKNKKSIVWVSVIILIIVIIAIIAVIFLVQKPNSSDSVNSGNIFSFLDNIKKETVNADTYEDILSRISAELDNEDELYYFSYSVMYYITRDGMSAAFTNPDDENAMYVNIYGKTVGQLLDEGKELMKQNDMTVEKFKESLKTASEEMQEE